MCYHGKRHQIRIKPLKVKLELGNWLGIEIMNVFGNNRLSRSLFAHTRSILMIYRRYLNQENRTDSRPLLPSMTSPDVAGQSIVDWQLTTANYWRCLPITAETRLKIAENRAIVPRPDVVIIVWSRIILVIFNDVSLYNIMCSLCQLKMKNPPKGPFKVGSVADVSLRR